MNLDFKVKKQAEARTIAKIAERAIKVAAEAGQNYERLDAQMDITAVHVNLVPLRLDDLLAADDFNFAHDIFGIRNCLNRETGKLMRGFIPRFHVR